jgi:hypothetical protein
MTTPELTLWNKIKHFQLDEPQVDFKFSDRLARENGWSIAYSLRVIEEYKKFIFLCCITDSGVTPSDPVDQAWHLHLTFTKSYWIDLCKNTLEKEIHHNPTKGGEKEAAKFNEFYTGTRNIYVEKFGVQQPIDIWQPNKTRFSDINFQRINLKRYWLIKKPGRFLQYQIIVAVIALIGICSIQATSNYLPIIVIAVVFISIVIIAKSYTRKNKSNNKNNSGSGCGGSGCSTGGGHHGHSGCGSGCSGCSGSGCSGCGGGD